MHNYTTKPGRSGKLRAGVMGFTGYSGAELVALLQKHPAVEPVLLAHRKAEEAELGRSPLPISGAAQPIERLAWSPGVIADNTIDVVFTATPPEVSMEVVPEVLAQGA